MIIKRMKKATKKIDLQTEFILCTYLLIFILYILVLTYSLVSMLSFFP